MSEQSKARWTPGPWSITGETALVEITAKDTEGLHHIASCDVAFYGEGFLPAHEMEANARLIAAAPELVEALKDCAAVLAGETMSKRALIDALEKARAALAKAEGAQRTQGEI